MKKILLLLVLVFSISYCEAQNKWGKVDPGQFAIRKCSFDSSANAIILLDSAYITIERNQTAATPYYNLPRVLSNIYIRMLILNKEGIPSSTVNIPFVNYLHYQQISNIEAQTLNINDKGKIQISKVKSDAIFYDTLVKGAATNIKFAFPDVKEGSIIEYKYTSTILGIQLPDWIFETMLPVVRSALSLKIPDYAYNNMHFQGYRHISEDKVERYNDWNNYVTGTKAHFSMDNIVSYKVEPFVPNIYDRLDKIRFYVENTRLVNGTIIHSGYASWYDVAKRIAKSGGYFAQNANMAWSFLAKQLTNGLSAKADKIKTIYNYMHTTMSWNRQYGYIPSNNQSKINMDTVGNSAEINSILLNMLRAVNINAYPVLISTQTHGSIDTSYYTPQQFNNMIVQAESDSTDVLLDAVNANCPWYMLPEDDLNVSGLLISQSVTDNTDIIRTEWVPIMPSTPSTTILSAIIKIDSAGDYSGRDVFSASGYLALRYRDMAQGKSITESVKTQLKIPDDMDIKTDTSQNENDAEKNIRIIYDLQKLNTTADSIIYITPFPVKFYSENPFNQSERVNPIFFGYGIMRSMRSTITLPPNYTIVELPKEIKATMNDGSAAFTLMASQEGAFVQMRIDFTVGSPIYEASQFSDLKTIYSKMIDACNSVIVLKRK